MYLMSMERVEEWKLMMSFKLLRLLRTDEDLHMKDHKPQKGNGTWIYVGCLLFLCVFSWRNNKIFIKLCSFWQRQLFRHTSCWSILLWACFTRSCAQHQQTHVGQTPLLRFHEVMFIFLLTNETWSAGL